MSPQYRVGTFGPGNPGRPRGSGNRTSQAVEALLCGKAEAVTRKAVEMALAGDTTAMRLCLERVCPLPKDAPVQFELPSMTSAADCAGRRGDPRCRAEGDPTLGEAAQVMALVETFRRTLETSEMAKQLAELGATIRGTL